MDTNQLKEQVRKEFDKKFTREIEKGYIDYDGTNSWTELHIYDPSEMQKEIKDFIDSIIDRTEKVTYERIKISFLKFVSTLPTFRDYHFELNGTPYCDHSEKLRGKQEGEMVDLINRYSLYRFLLGKNTGHVEQYSSEDLLKDVEYLITNKSNLSSN